MSGTFVHGLVLDGVCRRTEGKALFQETRAPTGDELKGLLDKLIARLMKMLTRLDYLVEEQGPHAAVYCGADRQGQKVRA